MESELKKLTAPSVFETRTFILSVVKTQKSAVSDFENAVFWTYDDYALVAVITLIFGPWFVLFLSPAFFIIWDYIGEKYGKKQY
ncbi:MAG: hypothetical protein IIT56_03435, partial [Bacteroidales bacterium]|nr:hypothetical protein [Bacteroidales bacterium]